MDDSEVAYIAGIIDSGGGLRVRVASGTRLPMVFYHGNMPVLRYLARVTGTKVTVIQRSYARAGCNEHCPEQHEHVFSESGRWSVTGGKATVLLWNVLPHLRLQREKAEVLLPLGLEAPRKAATWERMLALGWELPE